MSFSSLCAATKYIVLTSEYHDQKQKPAWNRQKCLYNKQLVFHNLSRCVT